VELAAAEAVLRGTELRVICVRRPDDRWPTAGQRRQPPIATESVLAQAVERAVRSHPRLSVVSELVEGSPIAVLIEASARAELTVVGHRGRGGFLGLAAGSVCSHVMTRGYGPILITRRTGTPHPDGPVMLGIDADAPVRAALDFAFTEANLRGVPLRAAYVWSRPGAPGPFAAAAYCYDEASREAARRMAEAIAGWSQQYPDVKLQLVVRHSLDPAAAVLAGSEDASLVVLGSHNLGGARRLLLGSVTRTLAHHRGCPIAVVHPTAAEAHEEREPSTTRELAGVPIAVAGGAG
jgi:nucleotide-binding universal stress UspA family protein